MCLSSLVLWFPRGRIMAFEGMKQYSRRLNSHRVGATGGALWGRICKNTFFIQSPLSSARKDLTPNTFGRSCCILVVTSATSVFFKTAINSYPTKGRTAREMYILYCLADSDDHPWYNLRVLDIPSAATIQSCI